METSPLSRECRSGCALSLSPPETGGRGDDSSWKGAVGALRFPASLYPAHGCLCSPTHPCRFLEMLWLFLAGKVVSTQGANIQVLVRGCQTSPQTISARALGSSAIKNSSSRSQTSRSPLLCPVLPLNVCMFVRWHCMLVTLRTSSQNKYRGKRMVEEQFKKKKKEKSLFLYLVYSISSQGEQRWTGQRGGDSLGWYCFQHPHTGEQWQPWTSHCVTYPVRPSRSRSGKQGCSFPWALLPQERKPGWAA